MFRQNVTGINLKWEITYQSPNKAGELCIRLENLAHQSFQSVKILTLLHYI